MPTMKAVQVAKPNAPFEVVEREVPSPADGEVRIKVAIDSEDTMVFSKLAGIKPRTEVFPLERAEEAFAKVMENKVRFRAVLRP